MGKTQQPQKSEEVDLLYIEACCNTYNNLGDHLFSELSIGLSCNLSIKELYSAGNNLGKLSSIILGTIIRYDKKLTYLDISSNQIYDNVISYFFKGLISNTNLKILLLNNMKLSVKSLDILETTLYINTYLREIYLENNLLSNKACDIINRIFIKNKYIEYFSILGNVIDNDGVDVITENKRSNIKLNIISKKDYIIKMINANQHSMCKLFESFSN